MKPHAKTALALALAIVGGIAAGMRCDASEWVENSSQTNPRPAAYTVKTYTEGSDPFVPNVEIPSGASALELDVGNAFARVRWNGIDLGTRAWAPYSWPLPSGAASRGRLEITVYTNIVNIFGDQERKGAKWDVKFWNPQHDDDSAPGLFTVKITWLLGASA